MRFDPSKPYDDLPSLPPTQDVETRAVLKACIEARAAVAELRQAGALIPNQGVLINSIPLLEAQASSEIENIVTTADRLFLFDGGTEEQADPATREALRYRAALWEGYRSLQRRPLCTATAVDVVRAIKGIALDVRRTPGTQLVNDRTGEAVYTPPAGEARLRDKLADWERYLHAEGDTDPLVRMAVMHYQFEAIHPFVDGNGRTGRVLNLLYLVERGLLDIPVLYLSRYIVQHKADYYRLLLAVTTHEQWEGWILYMLAAVANTARWTTRKIAAIRALIDTTAERMRTEAPHIYSRELAELIFERPYTRIAHVVDAGIAKRQTASVYLKELCAVGLLEERKVGREKVFLNPALIALLKREDDH